MATEGGAQRGAEAVADRHEQHQVKIRRRQVGQHFDFEIFGERLVVAHLVGGGNGRAIFLAADREQLQAGDPAIGQFVHLPGIAGADIAQLCLEKLLGLRRGKTQIPQVQFQYQLLAAQARQRQRHAAA
ncbi:hypothetical protein D3C73_1393450 [compost metagenome]